MLEEEDSILNAPSGSARKRLYMGTAASLGCVAPLGHNTKGRIDQKHVPHQREQNQVNMYLFSPLGKLYLC
jgi:hypothetical protein